MRRARLSVLVIVGVLLVACGDDTSSTDAGSTSDGAVLDASGPDGGLRDASVGDASGADAGAAEALVAASFFADVVLTSSREVECPLETGASTRCLELVFSADIPFDDGPYCPTTIDEVGGLGVYDGDTNAGFQVMERDLWESMEADGFDIVDEAGNVRVITDMSTMPGTDGQSFCLAMELDRTLTLTYSIPLVPELLSTPNVIDTVEKFGASLAGVPLTGSPPSATAGPPGMGPGFDGFAAIPSLDHCGGHPDPMGYYHHHFIPESVNAVLSAFGITNVSCTAFEQDASALSGFAFDGFPVYAAEDPDGAPTDLDACNGHTGPTAEFPGGVYHYHADPSDAPNMPSCLRGASATNPVVIR